MVASGLSSGSSNEIEVLISGKDQISGDIGTIVAGLDKLKTTVGAVSGALAALGAKGISDSVAAFSNFDEAMQESIAIMGDVSAAQRQKLAETAREVAKTTTKSHREAAESFYFLASAGFDAAESIAAMPEVAALAEAGALDMATATDYASDILSAFQMDVGELSRVTDTLTGTVTRHNSTMEGMGSAMSYVAPIAEGLGVSIEETSAAIGFLSDAGIKGSKAGTTLRQALNKLAAPTSEAKEILAELGVEVQDSEGNMRSFTAIIRDLEEAGASTGQVMELFGTRAGPGMQVLLNQGADAIEAETKALREMEGVTQSVADTQKQTLNKQLDIFRSKLEDIAIVTGKAFIPAITEQLELANAAVDAFADLNERTDGLAGKFTLLGSVVAGATGALALLVGGPITAVPALLTAMAIGAGKLYDAWKDDFGGIATETKRVAGVIAEEVAAIKQSFTALPIDLVAGAFKTAARIIIEDFGGGLNTAADIAIAAIRRASDEIQSALLLIGAFFNAHIQEIHDIVLPGFWGIHSIIEGVMTQSLADVENGLSALDRAFSNLFSSLPETVREPMLTTHKVIVGVLDLIKTAVTTVVDFLTGIWAEHGEAVVTKLKAAYVGAKTAIVSAIGTIEAVVGAAIETLTGLWDEHGQAIKESVIGYYTDLKTQVSDAVEGLKQTVGEVIGFLNEQWATHRETVMGAIEPVVGKLQELGEKFGFVDEQGKPTIETIGSLGTKLLGLSNPVTVAIGLADTLGTAWEENLLGLQETATEAVDGVKAVFDENKEPITESMRSIATGVIEAATALATDLQTAGKRAVELFLGEFKEALPQLKEAAAQWPVLVGEQLGLLKEIIGTAWTVIRDNIIAPALAGIEELIEIHGGELLGEFAETYTALQTLNNETLGAILDLWREHRDTLIPIVQFLADTIGSIIGGLLDGLLTTISVGMDLIQGDWEEAWGKIKEFAQRILDGLVTYVEEWHPRFVEMFTGAVEAIATWLGTEGESQVSGGVQLLVDGVHAIIEGAFTLAGTIGQVIKDFASDVADYFASGEASTDIKAAFKTLGEGIRAVVLTFFDMSEKLGTVIKDFVSDFADYMASGQGLEDLKAAFTTLGDMFVTKAEEYFGMAAKIGKVIKEFVSDFVDYMESGQGFKDLKKAFGVLIDMIFSAFEGLYEGLIGESLIPEMFGDIADYVKGGGKKLIEKALAKVIGAIMTTFRNLKTLLVGEEGLFPKLVSKIESKLDGIDLSGIKSAIDTVIKKANKAIDKIGKIPDNVSTTITRKVKTVRSGSSRSGITGGVSGTGSSTDVGESDLMAPVMHSGGFIERGGLAVLQAGEQVVPAAQVDRTRGGGDTISITVKNNHFESRDDVDYMVDRLGDDVAALIRRR